MNLGKSLRGIFSTRWPPGSMRGVSHGFKYTIRMSDKYRQVTQENRPDEQYQKAIKNMEDIIQMKSLNLAKSEALISNELQQDLMDAIFRSNAIENVGGNYRVTFRLCKVIFDGEYVDVEMVDDRDSFYRDELEYADVLQRPKHTQSIIRGRYEIIQHAKALKHLVNALVVKEESLTEGLIKKAHEILMDHSEHKDIGGIYRTGEEAASWGLRNETDEEYEKRVATIRKYKPNANPPRLENMPLYQSKFIRGQSVPIYMRKLVAEYIHPFEDGNGRICRLLMNCILLKYAGVCIGLGGTASEREAYIKLANDANKVFSKEERDDIEWADQKSYAELGSLVIRKANEKLQSLWNKLAGK